MGIEYARYNTSGADYYAMMLVVLQQEKANTDDES
jgi:hypothetical protein